ncbi:MAG: acyl carrier protein [Armatimonadetes bacterium CG2_30_59_28]|nr:acyl carrier protein [Armatimonadota bacterium]OIO89446.1 MAG: acyl carrier protein [Armatimonadetes bacterium CG2_30_59_28]PIU64907.1 MAG: acyl carrier protein [Armatimonadetes bacterium CG07_land_8_20_14_0_80_59_28]PIX41936.1 MAG: acyl carrier protein [Armatimonadetes bacterium CG_4_8_14_3_um_filter_58_9]PIY39912.1 MAG: acyl carrier protein [Armatimonadetes bacterium CG_4_10_14_3_um_filter_59_10]PJB69160.1 MAG: acyl carrier protein [Armatimonadetes bacterium CG_4_9_14_3_um_filter_58_7]
MSNTLERVKKVTADLLKIEETQIDESSRFVEDLGAQSIQSVELVAALEEELDIELDEEEALKVKTVGDAVAFIDELLE